MGMCDSEDIFQAKGDKLLGDIEGVKTYTNDILSLSKDCFKNHIDQLKIIFSRLRAAGFKVKSPKCRFWFKYVPYLGYIITREGIKLNRRKYKGSWILGDQLLLQKRNSL